MTGRYPDQREIDARLAQYKDQEDPVQRTALLRSVLSDLKSPDSVADETLLKGFLTKLVVEYRAKNDEAMLAAVDATPIDAGFANYVCSFYSEISSEKGFQNRYVKKENLPSIKRCAGISFSKEMLEGFETNSGH